MNKTYTENEVKKLRNNIYGVIKEDKSWEACKDNWMKVENVEWLLDNQPEITQTRIAAKVAKMR